MPDDLRSGYYNGIQTQLDEIALNATAKYHRCLWHLRDRPYCVEIDGGNHPRKFIAAQIKYPSLRKLYEERRASEAIRDIFRAACRDIYDRH